MGARLRSPYSKDHRILGSVLGPPHLWKLPNRPFPMGSLTFCYQCQYFKACSRGSSQVLARLCATEHHARAGLADRRYLNTRLQLRIFIYTYIHIYRYTSMYAYIYICTYMYIYVYVCMSSDLKVLVRDLYKSGPACMFRHSRKFREDIRGRKVQVSRKFYVTHVVKISVFRKSREEFRERSAMVPRLVAANENASSIGRCPCPGNRVVIMILDILKYV